MKPGQLLNPLWLASTVPILVVAPAMAQTQVTGVQLNPTANGLEVILQTSDGNQPPISTSSYDRTLPIDVLEAQLVSEFRQANPISGITSVTVTPLYNNSVRVTIVGETNLPIAQVTPSSQGLVVSVAGTPETAQIPAIPTPEPIPTPSVAPPEATPNEEFELVVTGDQDRYRVPDASTATRTDTAIFYRRDRWRGGLNIKNLLGVDYYESARDRNAVFPGAPMTIQGTVSVEL